MGLGSGHQRWGDGVSAVFVLLAMSAALLFGLLPVGTPDPLLASAAPEQFSSARALEHVRAIAGEPRPMGSAHSDAVRMYLLEKLTGLGLQAEVQEATTARLSGDGLVAGRPKNVLARLEGAGERGKAFLVVAHYDSVPTGPGASDDGAGVAAVLETVRALKAGPILKNDVIVLFTDGEERGLLGAQAFVDSHPWASEIAVVLNLETRGNTGAARLFEASDQNGWIIGEFAKAVPYPVANSGSTAGYQLSGSDTDLTVFLNADLAGLNVAYLEGLAHYHTRLDTVDALDEQSLQHLGSYALALTRQFGDADLDGPREPDAVFFTVLGFMVHYPALWSVPFAGFAVLMFAAVLTLGIKRGHLTLIGIGTGFLAFLVAIVISALGGYLVWLLTLALNPSGDVWALQYRAGWHWLGLAGITVFLVAGLYAALGRRLRAPNLAVGAMSWWLVAAISTAVFFPAASFGLMWPLVFSVLGLGATFLLSEVSPWQYVLRLTTLTLTAAAAILVYSPAIQGMTLIAGLLLTPIVPVFAVVITLLLGLLIPHLDVLARPHRWLLPTAAAVIGLTLLLAGALPARFDSHHPKPNSILYALNADTKSAIWASYDPSADAWTDQFLGLDAKTGPVIDHLPGARQPLLHAEAPELNLPTPTLRFLEDSRGNGVRTLRARVAGPPGTSLLTVTADALIISAEVSGVPIPDVNDQGGGGSPWKLDYWSPPVQGFELILQLDAGQQVTLTASAGIPGLPAPPNRSYRDRPADMMAAAEDMTVITRSFTPR